MIAGVPISKGRAGTAKQNIHKSPQWSVRLMLFNSSIFLLFLPCIWLLFRRSTPAVRPWILLAGSYFFYGMWSTKFLALLILSTSVDYGAAIVMCRVPPLRRAALGASMAFAILLLLTFKYYGFFAREFQNLVSLTGYNLSLPLLQVTLPVGISFYTFQAMSYTLDVYKGRIQAEKSWLAFANYVAFFPQLVAGPIERAAYLLPQLRSFQHTVVVNWERAMAHMCIGMTQKVIIGDRIAPYVDHIFYTQATQSPTNLLAGLFLFSIQLYVDFAGYSNIARGTALLFGVELSRNFREPYLAANIQQFWRDWHITLSQWLRDYVYVPLGGNKSSRLKQIRNILITFFLGGLWHGANLTYVLWGLGHGFLICLHILWRTLVPDIRQTKWTHILGTSMTYLSFTFLLIPFRSPSLGDAYVFLIRMWHPSDWIRHANDLAGPMLLLGVILGYDILVRLKKNELFFLDLPKPMRLTLVTASIALSIFLIVTDASPQPFIYFQF